MDNLVLRSATDKDLGAIHKLAEESEFGLTTLPKDRSLLAQRLEYATLSWQHIRKTAEKPYFLFVLENPDTHQIIGTCAIEAKTGVDAPFYSYRLSKHIKPANNHFNHKPYHEDELLNLTNDYQGVTELCTLYLTPAYRREKCGNFLSRARFLFMAQNPSLFSSTVIAELRGVANAQGESPFWNALGYHFFNLSFVEADRLSLSTDKRFIRDHMPEYPIYTRLLPKAAREAIGKPHKSTAPAMHLLTEEGFYYNHCVDIFDAGPMLEVTLANISTLKNSQIFTFAKTTKHIDSVPYLISNIEDNNFRATKAHALLDMPSNSCTLTERTAELLQLEPGNSIRIALF